MANIMQMFRAKNKVSRAPFDLSKKIAFTAQAGELNPVYSRIMMQGDVADISTRWKTRTAPLNTAAFTRFREYYDWFFVPLNLLWDKYNVWSTNLTSNNQVATSINGTTRLTDKHPYMSLNQIRNYLNGVLESGHGANAFGLRRDLLSKKLLSYLGYGDFYADNSQVPYIYDAEVSPWRLLAYQKIYQDWFRNTQWESASPETCNINYIDGSVESLQLPISEIDYSRGTMFDLQYANWNKDMFMGVLPNSQYGDAASVIVESDGTQSYPLRLADNVNDPLDITLNGIEAGIFKSTNQYSTLATLGNPIYRDVNDSGVAVGDPRLTFNLTGLSKLRNSLNLGSSSVPISNLVSQFTILALRQAEALQKFKEIQQSNSQDFPSQSEAHFNYRPSEAYSQRCRRIGGYDGTIEIQDIDNTNITQNEDGSMNAADIAGKGLARGSGNLKRFTADVPGVLMCIHHIVPLLDYALAGVAPDNLKTNFTDYAIPEFDKTGMVQVPLVMLTNRPPEGVPNLNPGDGLLGYAPNYFDYKTDIDEVKGAFYNGGLESWVAPITKNYISSYLQSIVGSANAFMGIDFNFFKINPSVTNGIFATDVDSDVSSDKFWINCYHDIKMVRPLDADGLPY